MRHSKSSLFLMELIISLLFFSMASAVCVQLFSKSHMLSRSTVNENHSITVLQNMAETWFSADGDLKATADLLDNAILSSDGSSLFLLYDKDWEPVDCNLLDTAGTISIESASSGDLTPPVTFIAELQVLEGEDDNMLHAYLVTFETQNREAYELIQELNLADVVSNTENSYFSDSIDAKVIYTLSLQHHVAERRGNLE